MKISRPKLRAGLQGAAVGLTAAALFFAIWHGAAPEGAPPSPDDQRTIARVIGWTCGIAASLGAGLGVLAASLRRWRAPTVLALALVGTPVVASLTLVGLGAPLATGLVFGLSATIALGVLTIPLASVAGITIACWVKPRTEARHG